MGGKVAAYARLVLLVMTGMLGGAFVEREVRPIERVLVRLDPSFQGKREDAAANTKDRPNNRAREVPCPPVPGTMVALIVGQSNTGNFAAVRTKASPRVSVFYRGRCYEAADPLLGASGARGSPWPMFANRILASGRFGHVLLVPAAVGATPMESWTPGGIHHDRITSRVAQLDARGFAVSHVLIGQGEYEAEAGSDPAAYRAAAIELIRSLPRAAVFFATTGRCEGAQNTAIREAQAQARAATGALAGPDMDLIEDRINGCHLGPAGQRAAADGWADAVLSASETRPTPL